jgi:hypothetical protein
MAYAEDLKSFALYGACGFDPHPGHFIQERYDFRWSKTARCLAQLGELFFGELVFEFAG